MIWAVPALTNSRSEKPLIAFCARFYSHYKSVRTHSCIYISTFNGSHRRKVWDPPKGLYANSPYWITKDKIAWVADCDSGESKEIWTYSLRSSHAKKIGVAQLGEDQNTEGFFRGATGFHVKLKDGSYGYVDSKSGVWRKTRNLEETFQMVSQKGMKPTTYSNPSLGTWSAEISQIADTPDEYGVVAIQGKRRISISSPTDKWFWKIARSKIDQCIYVEAVFLEHQNHYILSRFNWKSGKLDRVLDECSSYNFIPSRRWYSYLGMRQVQPLGHDPRSVWSHDIWVGDFKSGKKWQLFPTEIKEIDGLDFQTGM